MICISGKYFSNGSKSLQEFPEAAFPLGLSYLSSIQDNGFSCSCIFSFVVIKFDFS